ncbi:MAG: cyclic nucleotide-binding domain-containing protein [Spirochaetales bacterium]|nr:cyclic nucleotide-binding domain-containing protein [Spirochaetales bacterium]MCF7937543.1 cyclic nucleotide-binding domain-containing protein [Spirochaetales bacterium]
MPRVKTPAEIEEFLRRVDFFRDLGDFEVQEIAKRCRHMVVEKGRVIFREGEKADGFYIIVDGRVQVWKDYGSDEPDLLAEHETGRFFGEMALIDQLPRSATVITRDESELLYLERQDFQKIVEENVSVAKSILVAVSSMVRASNETFVEGLRQRNRELKAANKELQKAQHQLLESERLSALGRFSSLILHDIKNPIGILKGYAEMVILHADDPDRVKEYADHVVKQANRLNELTGELLDYARGEIRLNLSVVNLKEFFREFAGAVKERFTTKQIDLRLDIREKGPVMLDQARMMRVFLNLADNARKAMPEGGTFAITTEREGDRLIIRVADTGSGMSEEIRKRMFEPFYSFSKMGGTGLGMLIVKNVIDAHEGHIEVESEIEKGTTFTITLPIRV